MTAPSQGEEPRLALQVPEALLAGARGVEDGLSTWRPVDLAEVLSDDYEPPRPSVGRCEDGRFLFYPGKMHIVSSEPQAGKTWLALAVTKQEVELDHNVVYIDYDDGDAQVVAGRLLLLGVPLDRVLGHFHYINPQEKIGDHPEFWEQVAEWSPSLVVIDGVTDAMTVEDLSIMDNQDATRWLSLLARPLARLGAAVVLLDHEVKRSNDRDPYPLGAGSKLAAVSGASYKLKSLMRGGQGRDGASSLHLVKDRLGQVSTPSGERSENMVATLVVTGVSTDAVHVTIKAGSTSHGRATRDEGMRERVLLAMGSEEFNTKTEIKERAGGNSSVVTRAINDLIADGHVSGNRPYKVIPR